MDNGALGAALAGAKKMTDSVATGLDSTSQNADGTINVTYKDGKTYITPVIKGDKGDTGATGPQGPQGPAGKDGSGATYDDTEIKSEIAALDTKVDALFDLVDDIHYITALTKATMVDPTTLENGVWVCIVKQDEDYPKEGTTECYSTLYICITDDTPTWEFIGKLNVSEKSLETMVKSAVAQANVYSTEETVIGTYMGKPLYRKVITSGLTLPNCVTNGTTVTSTVNHNISNVELFVNYRIFSKSNGHIYSPCDFLGGNNGVRCFVNPTVVSLSNAYKAFNGDELIAILEYTKTTDTV